MTEPRTALVIGDLLKPEPISTWTLHVEQLGKLRTADIRVHPLILFVGENNTGKTYLATVLHALMTELPRILPESPQSSPAYEQCRRWVRGWFETGAHPRDLQTRDCAPFLAWLNEILTKSAPDLLARAFNHEIKQATRIELRDLELLGTPRISLHNLQNSEDDAADLHVEFEGYAQGIVDLPPSEQEIHEIIGLIASRLIDLGGADTVYLPASRTGIVHLYREVTLRSNESRRIRPRLGPTTTRLTTTVVDFIELLTELDADTEARFHDEAHFLEDACLAGKIEVAALPLGRYYYRPSGSADPLPMALSSAVVTELAPIILTLRHKLYLGLLILEEPEAHLHPKLQRILAQVIVRLIRKGLRVCITTHSENFCQQINNFLKIGALPDPGAAATALGYAPGDHLSVDEVIAYEFKNLGDHAVVEELRRSPTGLQMPLFNSELLKLSNETMALQDLLEKAAGDAA
jgi:predicted ATPase